MLGCFVAMMSEQSTRSQHQLLYAFPVNVGRPPRQRHDHFMSVTISRLNAKQGTLTHIAMLPKENRGQESTQIIPTT